MNQNYIIAIIIGIAILTIILIFRLKKNEKKRKSKSKGKLFTVSQVEKAHHTTATIYYIIAILVMLITILYLWPVINQIKELMGM